LATDENITHNHFESFLPAPRWLPIETAPKDGTEILLTDGHYKRTGYWARRIEAWSIDTVVSLNMPTHWMPLPEPPR
jgi:hypothetical protein